MFSRPNSGDVFRFASVTSQSSEVPNINPDSFRCIAFSGTMVSSERIIIQDCSIEHNSVGIVEALNSSGEWVAVFQNFRSPDQYIILADPFCYQTVFYTLSAQDGLLVTPSFRAINGALAKAGETAEIDWHRAAGALGTDHSWAITVNSDETFAEGVKNLHPGQFIFVSGSNYHVLDTELLDPIDHLSYEVLLNRGLETASKQIEVLSNADIAQRRIYMSGGKDSRVMLALITGGGHQNKWQMKSVDPSTWPDRAARKGLTQDLLLADAMRRRYSMAWATEGPMSVQPISLYESLDYWQHFRSAKNYRFTTNYQMQWSEDPYFELRGAGGETYRYFWRYYLKALPSFASLGLNPESFESDAAKLAHDIYRLDQHEEAMANTIRQQFLESLQATGRNTILEAVDVHFNLYRNRGHFGHVSQSNAIGAIPFFPPSQRAWTKAGEKITEEQRVSGQMFFDIIETLNPELNDLRFDSDHWPDEFYEKRHNPARRDWDIATSASEVSGFQINLEQAQRRRKEALAKVPADRMKIVQYPRPEFLEHETREVIRELSTLNGSQSLLTPAMKRHLNSVSLLGGLKPSMQLAKLHTLRDIVMPVEHVEVHALQSAEPTTSAREMAAKRMVKQSGITSAFRTNLSTISFNTNVEEINKRQFIVSAIPMSTNESPVEWAFTLLVDGKKTAEHWYSDKTYGVFDTPEAATNVVVKVFARYKDDQRIVFWKDANVLSD
ncbi:hypothetical protein [Corynebacterium sp. H130]|uniref:hypothetical protein n=1 Tax=Corynebacterium sp. H130 TaxID=3133444 RepID=UPI0030A13D30